MKIKELGVMIDCSRDAVYSVETLKRCFTLLHEMGYTYVQLYTEDVYELEGEPYFGYLRGRYTKAELKELDAAARGNGLELIPCIQTLAHLGGIARWQEYAPCIDFDNILLAGEERTYALIDKMFAACAECFSSRRINIGMDEAHMVGLGKYLDRHGYEDRFGILLKHLTRVSQIAAKYGFSPMMWSDMFFRLANGGEYYCASGSIPEEVTKLVPENVTLVYWDYYSTDRSRYDAMIRAHKQFPNKLVFAGGNSGWYGFAPHNRYAVRACGAAVRACLRNGVEDVFITCWNDDGGECSLFATLPVLFAAAQFARGNFDEEDIARRFRRFAGLSMEDFFALDEADLDTESVVDPCKYMLYSDPFLGIFDRTVKGNGEAFAAAQKALAAGARSARYGYVFRTIGALCSVLELKYSLGVRTRSAYRADDRAALAGLISEYRMLEGRLKVFYRLFRAQWERECKPNGFEKHDIRLGGLMMRVSHCREVLKEYLAGKRARIPELEEDILPFCPGRPDGEPILFNNWQYTAQIKPLM